MDSSNTPRRVTRASMAALSASKNSPNIILSPGLAAVKRTPATKKPAGTKTPGASTGKRGRPKKNVSAVKLLTEDAKENIDESLQMDIASNAKKKLNLLNSEAASIDEEKEQEAVEVKETDKEKDETKEKKQKKPDVPKIKLLEATLINTSGMDVMETDAKELKNQNETKATFDETLNFSKLEEKGNLPSSSVKEDTVKEEAKIFDETLNFSKLEKVSHLKEQQKEVKAFDETLNYSKLEGNIDEVDRSKATLPQNFDETLGFSKMEEEIVSNNNSIKDKTGILETIDLCNSPMVLEMTDVSAKLNATSDLIINETTIQDSPSVQEISNTTGEVTATKNSVSETTIENSPSVQEVSVTTAEDEYIAKLCAEAAEANNEIQKSSEEPSVEPIVDNAITNHENVEETLNETFEINDSVFDQNTVTQTPVVPGSSNVDIETIEIEDTPLKPKTPHITQRRPFRKQQALEVPESLSVSCAATEKSILKRKKRSLSTGDITMNFTMQERRVKFHSPANMTVHLNEIDDRMMKSFTETNGRHQRAARRKRSLSDADYSQMKVQKTESSSKKSFKSKKMPDFAAIHSKQINRMESIADNLARKQERAAFLTTPDKTKQPSSDTNKDPSSAKKKKLENKSEDNSIRTENAPCNSPFSKQLSHVSEEKADDVLEDVKENELILMEQEEPAPQSVISSESEVVESSEVVAENNVEAESETVSESDVVQEVEVVPEKEFETEIIPENASDDADEAIQMETEVESEFKPKAFIVKPIVIKPHAKVAPQRSLVEKVQFKHKLQFSGAHPKKVEGQKTPVFNFAAKAALAAIKQGKETLVKPVNLAAKMNATHVGPSSNDNKNELPMSSRTAMKMKPNRQEEHKNLYKANKLCSEGQKKGGLLKGVRLNKRFELQMAYRNMKKE